jgi:hypothetical protein
MILRFCHNVPLNCGTNSLKLLCMKLDKNAQRFNVVNGFKMTPIRLVTMVTNFKMTPVRLGALATDFNNSIFFFLDDFWDTSATFINLK